MPQRTPWNNDLHSKPSLNPTKNQMLNEFLQNPNFSKNPQIGGFRSTISATKNAILGTKLHIPLKVPPINIFQPPKKYAPYQKKRAPILTQKWMPNGRN
jgi:hypothetical protein